MTPEETHVINTTFEAAGSILTERRFPDWPSSIWKASPSELKRASAILRQRPCKLNPCPKCVCYPIEPSQVDTEKRSKCPPCFNGGWTLKASRSPHCTKGCQVSTSTTLMNKDQIKHPEMFFGWVSFDVFCNLTPYFQMIFSSSQFHVSQSQRVFSRRGMRTANAIWTEASSFTLAIGPFCMKGKTPREHFI